MICTFSMLGTNGVAMACSLDSQVVRRRSVVFEENYLPALESVGHTRNVCPSTDNQHRLKILAYFLVTSGRPCAVENGYIQGKLACFQTNIDR
jgi:hypothetical protein